MPSPETFALMALAALAGGFLDAMVGGGGLLTMPALLLGMPSASYPVIMGTNKVLALGGTTVAAGTFVRARTLDWREMVLPALACAAGALGGSLFTYRVGRAWMGPMVVILLVAMFLWSLLRPSLGELHAPKHPVHHQRAYAALIAFALGAYDGFFGPGSGSMLIFAFVAVLGFDFLRASALAKAANFASDLAALLLFVSRGSWVPRLALTLMAANALGGFLGARMALRKGAGWVRGFFLLVVGGLILRLGWSLVPAWFGR
ncbi:MAG TPA: TSUP family transporter [Holophagaceae bacterium]|nr:TSUP family transporter [Holophagaceae bacterium]